MYTVVFDGDCGVCSRSVGLLRRWDRGALLELVASQTPGTTTRFPWIPPTAYAEALQLIGPGGRTWQGAAAVEEILRILPRAKWLAWLFDLPLARGLADRLYGWFARNRYQLGCGDHCQTRLPR